MSNMIEAVFPGYNAVNSRLDNVTMLESALYMTEDNKMKLRSLNEASVNVSTNFIRNIVRGIEKLFDHNPIAQPIMKTGGDIVKADHYEQFNETIKVMRKQLPQDKNIFALWTVQDFLVKNKALFREGFAQDNRNVQLLYFSLANAMFISGALLLATYCDFVTQNKAGAYFPLLRAYDIQDLSVSNMRSMANDINQGKVFNFLQESVSRGKNTLKESFLIPALFGATIAIFWFIRDFIVYFFKLRKSLADWMSSYSLFLEMRANSMKGSNKKVADTYADLSNQFLAVAKTIEIEAKVTSKETAADVKKISLKSEQLFNSDQSGEIVSF